MSASSIRVGILDDELMVLSGLRAWLERATDELEVVIEVASWAEMITSPAFPVDVVLLDLKLNDSVPAPVKIAMLRSSGVAVVVVSSFANPADIGQCLTAGALSYLAKSQPSAEMINAVKAAARGELYMNPTLAEIMLADDAINRPKLSDRELEVLQ